MSFLLHPPSKTWEPVPLPTNPPLVIWAWFKPKDAPNGVVFQLPPDLFKAVEGKNPLTIRLLLMSIGMEAIVGWTLYGQQIALDADTMRWLDADLPPPLEGFDPQLTFWAPLHAGIPTAVAAPVEPEPEAAAGREESLQPGENPLPYFEAIEFFWTNILYLESDIRRAHTQLEQSISKLTTLNRDLNFEEINAADSVDKQQWQDVRRWLREASFSLSRTTKEIDVELISSIGKRNQFLDIYEKLIKPRIPFPELKQAVVEFEMHHKSVRTLLQTAQAAIHKGTAEGERRANTILQRIAQKIRAKSNPLRGKNA